ncbi:hypothetical protein A3C26_04070 [Candidatus Daviesbacteria bacterium RIFCSPHIGHO2_02_FULL_39_12]|uniref:Uncharacterized protein n=1 Tax=Candidatus Daviesbacteria bacterium RIFCSPHIGHO2_02_FULL_39_12 TaxID=1797770 RepID=A0A1F5J9I3_9BACT|nr:MAG: hypothetical protein A3C26_04070 [Candidatus Daviesbacteria bacterium RIFCSPHIGHO2_02_FULL_39_12]
MAQDKKGISPAATGLAGAVVGAAATAAAIFLSNEKNRKKAEAVLTELQKEGDKILKEISRVALELKDRGENALPQPKKAAKKKAA